MLHEASRLGAKIPPTPRLPTINCEEVVSRVLFVKIHKAENLLVRLVVTHSLCTCHLATVELKV